MQSFYGQSNFTSNLMTSQHISTKARSPLNVALKEHGDPDGSSKYP